MSAQTKKPDPQVEAAKAYVLQAVPQLLTQEAHRFPSQAALVNALNGNAAYISWINNPATGKNPENLGKIAPAYWLKMAAGCRSLLEKKYASTAGHELVTDLFTELAQTPGYTTLIGPSASGKSHSLTGLCQLAAHNVFYFRVPSHATGYHGLLKSLAYAAGYEGYIYDNEKPYKYLVEKLVDYRFVIIDDIQRCKVPALLVLKDLYDELYGVTSILLVAEPHLVDTVAAARKRGVQGADSFATRFLGRIVEMPRVDFEDVQAVANEYGVEDGDYIKWVADRARDLRFVDSIMKQYPHFVAEQQRLETERGQRFALSVILSNTYKRTVQ